MKVAKIPGPTMPLSPEAEKQRKAYLSTQDTISPGRLLIVDECFYDWDETRKARQVLAKEGHLTHSERSQMPHPHPMLAVARESAKRFLKAADMLGLEFDPMIDALIGAWPRSE
jgi:phage terminase small subunit